MKIHKSAPKTVPLRWVGKNFFNRCLLSGAAIGAVIFWVPVRSLGLGARIPNQDAAAIARGNAFVATADNPSALYYNPAGITQLEGQQIHFGSLFYLDIDADYDSPAGARTKNKREVIPVPELHYTVSLKDAPVAFGLGIYAPFGLGMEWPDNAPFRTGGIEAKLTYLTINPVVAYKPHSTVSLAVGPTFNYSHAKLRQGVPLPPGAPPTQLGFRGDDLAYGFNAGILWQPHAQWSFGAKYFSASSMDYEGTAFFDVALPGLPPPTRTTTHVDFPQMVVAGVSFRPTPNWNIEFDVDWSDWDVVKNATIRNIGVLPLNWNSSFFYEFGVTRQLGNGYFVSAGYFFSESSTPEKNYTPLVPDTDLHVGSLGFGHNGEHWSWALATQIIGGEFRSVTAAADPSVNGRYKLFTPTVSFSVNYRF